MSLTSRLLFIALLGGPTVGAATPDVPPGRTESLVVALPEKTSFVIDNPVGAVEILEHAGDALEIETVNVGPVPVGIRTLWGSKNTLRVSVRPHPPTRPQLFDVNAPAPADAESPVAGRADLIVRIPQNRLADLDVTNNHGRLTLRGYFADDETARLRRISLTSCRRGEVVCENVAGRLSVRAVHQPVRLIKVIGEVYAASGGSIYVADGVGDVELDGGEIFARRNRGNLAARTRLDAIVIEDQAEGHVTASSHLGKIRLDNPLATESGRSLFGEVVKTRVRLVPTPAPTRAADLCLRALIADLRARE